MPTIPEIVRRAGTPFVVMGLGFLLAFIGLADDWYQHEIVGFSTALESFYAPVHLAIFSGVIVAGLGYIWGLSRIVSSVRRSETVLAASPGLTGPNSTLNSESSYWTTSVSTDEVGQLLPLNSQTIL